MTITILECDFFPQLEFNLYMITMGLHLFNSFKNVEIQK